MEVATASYREMMSSPAPSQGVPYKDTVGAYSALLSETQTSFGRKLPAALLQHAYKTFGAQMKGSTPRGQARRDHSLLTPQSARAATFRGPAKAQGRPRTASARRVAATAPTPPAANPYRGAPPSSAPTRRTRPHSAHPPAARSGRPPPSAWRTPECRQGGGSRPGSAATRPARPSSARPTEWAGTGAQPPPPAAPSAPKEPVHTPLSDVTRSHMQKLYGVRSVDARARPPCTPPEGDLSWVDALNPAQQEARTASAARAAAQAAAQAVAMEALAAGPGSWAPPQLMLLVRCPRLPRLHPEYTCE
jgi:hypothetical protein